MQPDFVIRFDPATQTKEYITKRLFYTLFVRRVQYNKPTVIGIYGRSGEGKSWAVLRLQEILSELFSFDLNSVVNDINVYTPFEYPNKLDKILFPKRHTTDNDYMKNLKRSRVFAIHEARTIVNAKDWQSFATRGVGHVNAMSRSIKRMIFIIVSQDIMDVSKEIRKQLDYYCTVYRPIGKKTRMFINKIYVDDHDIEKPQIKKRRLRGLLLYPDGKYRVFTPDYVEFQKPQQAIIDKFEEADYNSKSKILTRILDKMIADMRKQIPDSDEKVDTMVEWYAEHPDKLRDIGRITGAGNWKINATVQKMHGLSKAEMAEFMDKIAVRLNCQVKVDGGV